MDSSFFIMTSQASDLDYNAVRDDPDLMFARNYVEEMWKKYKLYAEPRFQEKAMEDFHAKIWEMYLGCVFIDNGMNLQVKQKEEGPDLCVLLGDRYLWVEAIAPESGKGDNAVPEANTDNEAMDVPESQVLLRLTGAIEEKYKKYQKYITGGSPIIKPKDYYVIAINGGRINFGSSSKGEIPFIVSCAYGLGDEVLTIRGNNVAGSHYAYREKIDTHAGSPVSTDIFLNKQYSGISAVLYSWMNVANHPSQAGSEIHLVHNLFASPDNSLPLDIFPFGTEWRIENNQLHRNDHYAKEIAG